MPYRYGWCKTCEDVISPCSPTPDDYWGWCQPQCDEESGNIFENNKLHETAVDSFVYPNCSLSVKEETEFCTGILYSIELNLSSQNIQTCYRHPNCPWLWTEMDSQWNIEF